MSKEIKQIRGQIRQIVKELLPEILGTEVAVTIQKALMQELERRLDIIDNRQKDLQHYLVKQSSPIQVRPEGGLTMTAQGGNGSVSNGGIK